MECGPRTRREAEASAQSDHLRDGETRERLSSLFPKLRDEGVASHPSQADSSPWAKYAEVRNDRF
jgi:hypothetical protein